MSLSRPLFAGTTMMTAVLAASLFLGCSDSDVIAPRNTSSEALDPDSSSGSPSSDTTSAPDAPEDTTSVSEGDSDGSTDADDGSTGTDSIPPADSTDTGSEPPSDTLDGSGGTDSEQTVVDECASPDPAWIWCDDFERDRTGSYFEYSDADGSFVRRDGVGVDGSAGMRARFHQGQVSAGSLRLAFGRTPQSYFRSADEGRRDYRNVYWRIRLRHDEGWIGGGGDKLSRATSLASPDSWAQAMIAHVWSGSGRSRNVLVLDPASGTDVTGSLQTTRYNDFENLRWLGQVRGTTPIFDAEQVGRWRCVEAHVRLNDAGRADGIFEMWIDGRLEIRTDGLNWVGAFSEYGVNAVFLENYWNDGAPQTQERYFDEFVISTERIGC